MRKNGLSQEGLKLVACVTMLLDHIGASVILALYDQHPSQFLYDFYFLLRIIGRIAFPIFCFLLVEGVYYTKNPEKYAMRLMIGAILAEIPYDLLIFGEITWKQSSVMVTLLLAFVWARLAIRTNKVIWKIILLAIFACAADLMQSDYQGYGVVMVAVFFFTRELPKRQLWQIAGVAAVCWIIGGLTIGTGLIQIPVQMFAIFALIPIFAYCGEKRTNNQWVQRFFYLFYPVHLLVLYLMVM